MRCNCANGQSVNLGHSAVDASRGDFIHAYKHPADLLTVAVTIARHTLHIVRLREREKIRLQ